MLNWNRRGRIFNPVNRYSWMKAYSQVPTILEKEDKLRIYFTTRGEPDATGKFISNTTFIDVKKDDPFDSLYIHDSPVMELGEVGTFDQFGIMPGCIIENEDKVYMYYTGWMRSENVPYITSIGIAASEDGGSSFYRLGKGPVFGRCLHEPFLENGPFVIHEEGKWHMWYASCIEWKKIEERMEPRYVIMHATSNDGFNWFRESQPCIEETVWEDEANGRPFVLKLEDTYHMWFCYRSVTNFREGENSYKIGYARSNDLRSWIREDYKGGLQNSSLDDQWDSHMTAYPFVFRDGPRLWLFYNGDYFGKYGFGLAETKLNENR